MSTAFSGISSWRHFVLVDEGDRNPWIIDPEIPIILPEEGKLARHDLLDPCRLSSSMVQHLAILEPERAPLVATLATSDLGPATDILSQMHRRTRHAVEFRRDRFHGKLERVFARPCLCSAHEAGRNVLQAHRVLRLVPVLTARTTTGEPTGLEGCGGSIVIERANRSFGNDKHRYGRAMNSTLAVILGDTLYAVSAILTIEAVGALT